MSGALAVLGLVLVLGMLLRMPIGFSMLAAGVAYLLVKRQDVGLVAEQVGVSSYYLSHLFTQETGKTYIAWLTEFRVRMARQLLAKRNFSLADLAAAVGYANPTYFAKIFRKITSHTVREVNDRCIESEE